jgi:hypothetical protein
MKYPLIGSDVVVGVTLKLHPPRPPERTRVSFDYLGEPSMTDRTRRHLLTAALFAFALTLMGCGKA